MPFPRSEIEQSIPERFQKQVELYRDRIAIETESEKLSYSELNKAANRIAHRIAATSASQPVLHLFEQGATAIVAKLGILKSANTYVPLDPLSPAARLGLIAEESQAKLIVTNQRNLHLAEEMAAGRQVINTDQIEGRGSDKNPDPRISPDELAWILYTSGSTGRPKGVMQTHRNVLHFMMNYTGNFHICPEDRLSNLFSFSTNAGSFGLLLALTTGATLLPLDLKRTGPAILARWLARSRITVSCMVPTVFRHFAGELSGESQLPDLRLIYLAGEPLLRADFELYRKRLSPSCVFVNRYGSTEMDCARLFFADRDTRIRSATVPIGYAVQDKEMLILDEQGRPAGSNQIGEIALRSRYISPGYWQRPELTAAAFVEEGDARIYRTGDLGRMEADGCVEHMGRKDFQVKIRGHRVEIAEVETALLELPEVKDAAVMAKPNRLDIQQLVAYVVFRTEPAPSTSVLRSALAAKLPDYMLPTVFMPLAELPYAPNGKVDRRSLPDPGRGRPDLSSPFARPRNPVEERLAAIWSEVLDLTHVGIHDPFLELGGESLRAMRILSRVRSLFGVELSPQELFDARTVALMAEFIQRRLSAVAESGDGGS